jgi:leucyl/phenylalanyl-tRNA---protein transferase
VALCRAQGVRMIDCQQNTAHLASLGAREMLRKAFCEKVAQASGEQPLIWQATAIEWQQLDARLAPHLL